MPYDKSFFDAVGEKLGAMPVGGDDKKKKGKSEPDSKIIPRPAPDDEKSIQHYRNELHKKYGERLAGREDVPEYLSQTYENEKATVKDIITQSAEKSGLRPEVFYASNVEEGMRGIFPTAKNKGQIDYSGNNAYPISGFVNFGLDDFSDLYPELKKKGYLPDDFDKKFQKSVETRKDKKKDGSIENVKVNSANFADLTSALQASAARLRYGQDEISKFAESKKIPLSNKAKEFFTLATFNSGIGNAQKMLQEYHKQGYLKDDKFLEKRPSEYWQGPYKNVIKRIQAADVLKEEQYL